MYEINNRAIVMLLQDDPIKDMIKYYHKAIDKELAKSLDKIDCNQIEKCVDCIIQLHEVV